MISTNAVQVSHSRTRRLRWRGAPSQKRSFSAPECQFVAVAQHRLAAGLAVDCHQRGGVHAQHNPGGRVKRQRQMLVPDAVLLQAQVGGRGAPDAKRKMAGILFDARHFAGKNFELDH